MRYERSCTCSYIIDFDITCSYRYGGGVLGVSGVGWSIHVHVHFHSASILTSHVVILDILRQYVRGTLGVGGLGC